MIREGIIIATRQWYNIPSYSLRKFRILSYYSTKIQLKLYQGFVCKLVKRDEKQFSASMADTSKYLLHEMFVLLISYSGLVSDLPHHPNAIFFTLYPVIDFQPKTIHLWKFAYFDWNSFLEGSSSNDIWWAETNFHTICPSEVRSLPLMYSKYL